jgi:hypothetical protein
MKQLAPPPLRTGMVKKDQAEYPWQVWFSDLYARLMELTNNMFVLKPATKKDLGGVIIGDNINVDKNGLISVDKGAEYELPVASDTVLGGVKIGSGISESPDGTISVDKDIQNKDHDALNNRQVLATSSDDSRHDAVALWYDGVGFGRYGGTPYGSGPYKGYPIPGMTVDDALDELFNQKPNSYILPEATRDTLGGIRLGDSLVTDSTGAVIVNPETVIQPNSDHDLLSNRDKIATSDEDSRHVAQAIWYDGVGFGKYGQGAYGSGQYKGYPVSGMTVDDALDEIFSQTTGLFTLLIPIFPGATLTIRTAFMQTDDHTISLCTSTDGGLTWVNTHTQDFLF